MCRSQNSGQSTQIVAQGFVKFLHKNLDELGGENINTVGHWAVGNVLGLNSERASGGHGNCHPNLDTRLKMSRQLVDDMQKQIKRTMESYEKLLGNIDSAVNRLDSRKRGLVINYRLLVGVAAVACLGVVASVGFLTVSLTATTAVGTAGFAAFFGTTVLTFKAIDWVDRVGKAIQNVGKALTALEDIKEAGDGLVTQLEDITFEVESVKRCIAQVERKLSDLNDTVQQEVILDHDQANLIQEHGRILVQKCDQMQQQFSLLEIQIEHLRDQVLKAQHSRRRLRNERTDNLATPLM